jgi:hypothetical protein
MKKLGIFAILGFTLFIAQACNVSTANISSFKSSSDKEGKTETTAFKTGDTLFANAQISNNPGKVKVKFYLLAEDVKGLKKGDTLKGSDVTVDVEGDGKGQYSVPVAAGFLAGTYKLNADMINEAGEKKDGKSITVTVTQTAPATTKADDADDDDK